MRKIRIRSGGQTGVDRAALDFALENGIVCGGWCPEGRLAEDGLIDLRYPLDELQGGSYEERTGANVRDSDATLIIYHHPMEGGTQLTFHFCEEFKKPCFRVEAEDFEMQHVLSGLREFLSEHDVSELNVAGPRHSEWPEGCAFARQFLVDAADLFLEDHPSG